MNNKSNASYIKDEEFELFLENDFANKLENDLRETLIGARIGMLEQLGLDISIKAIVKKYISKEGYTMDSVGNVYIHEDSMAQIFVLEEMRLSQELNIDISKIDDKEQLKQILESAEYKESVAKYGVENTIDWYNLSENKRKEIEDTSIESLINPLLGKINYEEINSFERIFDNYFRTDSLASILNSNTYLDMTDEEIEQAINEVENDTIEISINNKETVQGIRVLYRLREAVRNREEDGELSYQTEVKDTLNDLMHVWDDFQYKEQILDENGDIDVDKAVDFLNQWERKRNETKLFEDLSKAQRVNISDIKLSTLPKVLVLLGQAEKGEDTANKKIAMSMAKKLLEERGIDLLDETGSSIDFDKLSSMYKSILRK